MGMVVSAHEWKKNNLVSRKGTHAQRESKAISFYKKGSCVRTHSRLATHMAEMAPVPYPSIVQLHHQLANQWKDLQGISGNKGPCGTNYP